MMPFKIGSQIALIFLSLSRQLSRMYEIAECYRMKTGHLQNSCIWFCRNGWGSACVAKFVTDVRDKAFASYSCPEGESI